MSCYSCVCRDEWGGAHHAADHDNDLCEVIYSFVWLFFSLQEPGRVPDTLSLTLLKLQQQICGRPGDLFTPNVWLYTERLADNKPLVHRWITAWGPRKTCLLFFCTAEQHKVDSEPRGLLLESSRHGSEVTMGKVWQAWQLSGNPQKKKECSSSSTTDPGGSWF